MRFATLLLVLAAGCKAGEVAEGDQRGFGKPIETDRSQPLPGEGAASPTTAPDPADTPPTPANTEPAVEGDPWTASDPWAPAATKDTPPVKDEVDPWEPTSADPWTPTKDESVTASPALRDEADPTAPARLPKDTTQQKPTPAKRVPVPLR